MAREVGGGGGGVIVLGAVGLRIELSRGVTSIELLILGPRVSVPGNKLINSCGLIIVPPRECALLFGK